MALMMYNLNLLPRWKIEEFHGIIKELRGLGPVPMSSVNN